MACLVYIIVTRPADMLIIKVLLFLHVMMFVWISRSSFRLTPKCGLKVSVKIGDTWFWKALFHQFLNFKVHRGSLVHLVKNIFFLQANRNFCIFQTRLPHCVCMFMCAVFVCVKFCPISSNETTCNNFWNSSTLLYSIYYVYIKWYLHLCSCPMLRSKE